MATDGRVVAVLRRAGLDHIRDAAWEAAWVVWASARMQSRDLRGNKMVWIPTVVQPAALLIVTFATFASARPRAGLRAGGLMDTASIVVGVLLMALWGATIWTAGNILRRELLQGTLAVNFTGVRPPQLLLLGKCLGAASRVTAVIVVTTMVISAVLRAPLPLRNPFWLVLGLLVAVVSATALGMLMSCLFVLSRHGHHLSSMMMYPVYLLGGLLIPVATLPAWLRWMSSLVSLRWAGTFLADAARGTVNLAALSTTLALTAAYFLAAVAAFARVTDRARRRGTLDL
jgi:ABC-2 type transport system permease protein